VLGWTERGNHTMRNMYCSVLICSSCLTCFLWCGFKSSYSCPALLYIFSQEETLSLKIMRFWCGSNFVPSLTTSVIVVTKGSIFCPNHIFSDCSANTHTATVLHPDVIFVHCYFQKGNHILFSFNIWLIAWLVSVFLSQTLLIMIVACCQTVFFAV